MQSSVLHSLGNIPPILKDQVTVSVYLKGKQIPVSLDTTQYLVR